MKNFAAAEEFKNQEQIHSKFLSKFAAERMPFRGPIKGMREAKQP